MTSSGGVATCSTFIQGRSVPPAHRDPSPAQRPGAHPPNASVSGRFLQAVNCGLRGRTCDGIGTTGTTGTATASRGSREWKASHEALVQVNGGERLWRTTTAGALPYHHLGSRFAKPGDIGLVWQARDIGLRLRRLRGRHCSRRFICFVPSSATLSPHTHCATVYRGSSLYSERTTRATSP